MPSPPHAASADPLLVQRKVRAMSRVNAVTHQCVRTVPPMCRKVLWGGWGASATAGTRRDGAHVMGHVMGTVVLQSVGGPRSPAHERPPAHECSHPLRPPSRASEGRGANAPQERE